MATPAQTETVVEITADDLPLHCPTPRTPVWSYHPRVFLDVADSGEIRCPYCSTLYILKGPRRRGH
jgi:uncharacterized Zn-finger protein